MEEKNTSKQQKRKQKPKERWLPSEDEIIRNCIEKFGINNWTLIASNLPGRTGKQCRERWINQLDPHLTFDAWTEYEDSCLLYFAQNVGCHWAAISKRLPGRSPNAVKNRFKLITKQKIKMAEPIKVNKLEHPKIELLPSIETLMEKIPTNQFNGFP